MLMALRHSNWVHEIKFSKLIECENVFPVGLRSDSFFTGSLLCGPKTCFFTVYMYIHIHKRIVFKHYSIKPLAFGDQAKGGTPNRGGGGG